MFKHCIDYANIIIVFKDEAELYGCTHCGLSMAHSLIFVQNDPDIYKVSCLGCGHVYFCYRRSSSKIKCEYGLKVQLNLHRDTPQISIQQHPRFDIICHGKKDVQARDGGEYFGSSGIRPAKVGVCYKCGACAELQLTSSVRCEESGKRVVNMFDKGGATLNFRESSPCSVTVSVCACKKHGYNLKLLNAAARMLNGVITSDLVETS